MWRGALAAASRVPGASWSKYRTIRRQPFNPADQRVNPMFAEYDPSCVTGNLPRAGSYSRVARDGGRPSHGDSGSPPARRRCAQLARHRGKLRTPMTSRKGCGRPGAGGPSPARHLTVKAATP